MTFRTPPDKWEVNSGRGKATRAIIEDTNGHCHPGVRIKQETTGGWFILTEAHAVGLATQILDVIESQRLTSENRAPDHG